MTETTAVARRAITQSALALWEPEQVKLIKASIMPENTTDAELAMFLEVCARYELDPFSSQIWAIRYQGKVRNVVARDGWIAIAERHSDHRGCQSFEIREHDHFVARIEDGHVIVEHEWRNEEGNSTHGGPDGGLRGPIIGGFAYVRREGFIDTQFMAYTSQYDKQQNAWKTHPSAMMVKVAEAVALRKMYPISGLYADGELQADRAPTNLTRAGDALAIDFGEDEKLAHDLQFAFETLGYKRAKVRTLMNGCKTREEREEVLRKLNVELDTQEVPEVEIVDAEPTAA